MDDAGSVRGVECVRDFNRDLEPVIEAAARHSQALGQSLALEVLHDEKRRAVLLADVVERTDVGML